MKLDGLDHPKTLDLASRLDISLPQAIGHLELLWAFVAQKTPHGNVGKWPDGAIARSAHWTGDATAFVTALVEAGFIDRHQSHRLVVHDWHEHAPRWVTSKIMRAGESFCTSDPQVIDEIDSTNECSADCSADYSQDCCEHSKPSLVKSSQDKGSQGKSGECADAPAGKPAPKPKRARTIPDDFQPNDGHREMAAKLGVSLPDEFAKFCDHFKATGKPLKDWDSALNNWIRRSKEFQRGNGSGQQVAETPRQRAMRMAAERGIQYEPQ